MGSLTHYKCGPGTRAGYGKRYIKETSYNCCGASVVGPLDVLLEFYDIFLGLSENLKTPKELNTYPSLIG